MEANSAFLIAALMMLANGGVLGLMHRDLPHTLRPSAVSWRIATLLHACACLMFMVREALPQGFILPLANGLVVFGFTGYWRALRQFYGVPDSPWIWLPGCAATAGVAWYAAVTPDSSARIAIISVAWMAILLCCVRHLASQQRRDRAVSRRVMTGLFIGVIGFVVLRAAYFIVTGTAPGDTETDGAAWINAVSPIVAAVIPVIGTTAFLLMCSERIRRQWERAASTDYLTGLANRRTLADVGAKRFAAALAKGQCGFGLAVIDIDHFKSINDRHGHDIGDVALKHVAAQLEAACREAELPARQGGEEFVVLFDGVDGAGAQAAGERLRLAVAARPFEAGGLALHLTVSIGVAVQQPGDSDFDCLLRRADSALYAAKAGGRNRVECAALEIGGATPNCLELEQYPH
ncbi:GGDEF domain-containing protein [Pseudoduganella sp. LjRoot289]|uniref:GGDEF domain-containing protein n=1 Tax=Pseudoduganella sp. LjRoot289 TaxID=3342314 RepID=UPI003ECCDD1B